MPLGFQRIRILDSTTFQLPDVFAPAYQGSGGSSHTAGVKIQLEYDLLSGQFMHVHSGPGKQNDRTYGSTCLQTVQTQTGDLCICDLGYFDLKDLHQIDENGAYYISRLKLNTRIYLTKKKQELSEYKAIYIIKDYFLLLFQSIQKSTQDLSKVLFPVFTLLQKNGRKAHRYEKKTVFDILGVVYECTQKSRATA